jgi:predicted nucleotidyltransferase component of viral defense system
MIGHLIGGGLIMDLGILSREQNEVLERLKKSVLSNNLFYLAGGTGLAIILAHRKSYDFDFFSKDQFSTEKLLEIIVKSFEEDKVILSEIKEDTLIVFLNNIQVSFFQYNYPLLKNLIKKDGLYIASLEDILAMKVIAIIQRGTKKDFIDLWTIMKEKKYSLQDIFIFCKTKYGKAFSESIALKALTYFKDAEEETIEEEEPNFSWESIKKYLIENCRKYFEQNS